VIYTVISLARSSPWFWVATGSESGGPPGLETATLITAINCNHRTSFRACEEHTVQRALVRPDWPH